MCLLLGCFMFTVAFQIRPLNVEGSLNLLGCEQPRLIYFNNNAAGTLITLCALCIHHLIYFRSSSYILSDIKSGIYSVTETAGFREVRLLASSLRFSFRSQTDAYMFAGSYSLCHFF